jgi:hypothetical protein
MSKNIKLGTADIKLGMAVPNFIGHAQLSRFRDNMLGTVGCYFQKNL